MNHVLKIRGTLQISWELNKPVIVFLTTKVCVSHHIGALKLNTLLYQKLYTTLTSILTPET